MFTPPFVSKADQRKHQSSASLAFVRGIHRWSVNSPQKGPVTRNIFHLMTSSCNDEFTSNSAYHVLWFQASHVNRGYKKHGINLSHWGLVKPNDVIFLASLTSYDGLVADATKPLLNPILTSRRSYDTHLKAVPQAINPDFSHRDKNYNHMPMGQWGNLICAW